MAERLLIHLFKVDLADHQRGNQHRQRQRNRVSQKVREVRVDLADPGARGDQEDQEDRLDQPRQLNTLGNPEDLGDRGDLAGPEVQVDQQLDYQENQGDQVDPVDREVLTALEDRQQKHQELQVRKE